MFLEEKNKEIFQENLAKYCELPVFQQARGEELYIENNPFRRPLRSNDNPFINFFRPLKKSEVMSNSSLASNRILLNIYEQDMQFFPYENTDSAWEHYHSFYSPEVRYLGDSIRPVLERKVFSFLEDEISITGKWNKSNIIEYFTEFKDQLGSSTSSFLQKIPQFKNSKAIASYYLMQLAPDFLSEASAMSRNVSGSFEPIHSNLFKILIDEYGNGVAKAKHSNLFHKTMRSCGLSDKIHYYWQFYLPGSLLFTNYFHFLTKNHGNFFKYIGALYYTETAVAAVANNQSKMLRAVFGKSVDTTYFDEHVHIDQFHGQMVLDSIVKPVLDQFGDRVVGDILRGFEECQLIEQLAEDNIIAQVDWYTRIPEYREAAKTIYSKIQKGEFETPLDTFIESSEERSTTHVHPEHRLLCIENGTMNFWPFFGDPLFFKEGDIMLIPRNHLHGSVVSSDECVYHQPIVPQSMMKNVLNTGVSNESVYQV